MLALTGWIAGLFGLDVEIDGFVAAIPTAVLFSVVSALQSVFIGRRAKADPGTTVGLAGSFHRYT